VTSYAFGVQATLVAVAPGVRQRGCTTPEPVRRNPPTSTVVTPWWRRFVRD